MTQVTYRPEQSTDGVVIRQQPTRTYRVERGRILGMVDGYEAMRQALEKILRTVRTEWLIYSDQYGHDLPDLIGKDMVFAKAEVTRLISEALMSDDRVSEVLETKINQIDRQTLEVAVKVTTIEGIIQLESEVVV